MQNDNSIIITAAPNRELAKNIARTLVEKKLAACVQMFPIESIYFWQEKICEEDEIIMFIKSRTELFDKIKTAIKKIHTYTVPEIVQIPITDGLPEYLNWINDYVKK